MQQQYSNPSFKKLQRAWDLHMKRQAFPQLIRLVNDRVEQFSFLDMPLIKAWKFGRPCAICHNWHTSFITSREAVDQKCSVKAFWEFWKFTRIHLFRSLFSKKVAGLSIVNSDTEYCSSETLIVILHKKVWVKHLGIQSGFPK